MSCSCVALPEFKVLIYFNISSLTTGSKLKERSGNAYLIAVTLGSCSYFSTILSVSLLLSFSSIMMDEVLHFGILRFEAASVKKEFKVSATFVSLFMTLSFSTKVILLWFVVLLERKSFAVFQKVLLSVTFFSLRLP